MLLLAPTCLPDGRCRSGLFRRTAPYHQEKAGTNACHRDEFMPERKSGNRTVKRKHADSPPSKRRSASKDRKQFERFLEAARLHGVASDAETLFDAILRRLLRPHRHSNRAAGPLALGK
jgi:hypothetical protein